MTNDTTEASDDRNLREHNESLDKDPASHESIVAAGESIRSAQHLGAKYPEVAVQLRGGDGNIFFIMGRVDDALRRARVPAAEREEFARQVMDTGSYHEALSVVMKWVKVS